MTRRLHFQIDAHSGVPVYRQVMDQVRYYVASGLLQPGDQLPSIRELAQTLAVNPTTVVRAYLELEHERFLEMRHGKGAFVAASSTRWSARDREKALRRLARQLAIEAGQMGAAWDEIVRVLREEVEAVQGEVAEAALPAPLLVLPRR
jgi:GntR family transcriptional regulator